MSAYVKISYPSEKYNYAMRECIKFIGEHFGRSGRNPYKEGKRNYCKKSEGGFKNFYQQNGLSEKYKKQ